MTDYQRYVYLLGLKSGWSEGDLESAYYWIGMLESRGVVAIDKSETSAKQILDLSEKKLTLNFPEVRVVREVMTKFYADPSNIYLDFPDIFLISVAKIRGSSPELIERMLATARKESYLLQKFAQTQDIRYLQSDRDRDSLRGLFYKEVLKFK